MVLKSRSDGFLIRDLRPAKYLLPYIMPTRVESQIFTSQKLDASKLQPFLAAYNCGKGKDSELRLFHLLIAIIVRTLHQCPQLNRFIVGRRFYQHKNISISFVANHQTSGKPGKSDIRIEFTGEETLEQVRIKIADKLNHVPVTSMKFGSQVLGGLSLLPRPLKNIAVCLLKWLDYHNILPVFIMEAIPLFTSIYVANLGSIGLGSTFHHLFEIGTASSFLVIGKLEQVPMVDALGQVVARDSIEFCFTFDERVAEGEDHRRAIDLIRSLMADPKLLTLIGTSSSSSSG